MNNLQWLYQTDETFRNDVCASCAKWLGSTSTNFADAWLRETHRSDYEDLTGQHVDADVDSREKLEADVRRNFATQSIVTIMGWLDRQAAITEREVKSRNIEWQRELIDTLNELDDSAERIEELEAFAKRLKEAAKNGDDVTLFDVDYAPMVDAEYLESWDSASVADLLRQYEDGKLMRECDMETHVLIETKELRNIAEKYRADAIAAQDERDAYRELCGRMRKMANDMLCMEVD